MFSAIKYLHHEGIAHRDLKLENFLFEESGMQNPLKLIDFGLSKHFVPRESMHQVVGSAYYTAPEVLNGDYDHRCDVWSLGVISYMLLTGAPPFNGTSHHSSFSSPSSYSCINLITVLSCAWPYFNTLTPRVEALHLYPFKTKTPLSSLLTAILL